MGVSKLALAISGTFSFACLSGAAYLASVEPQSPNENLHTGASKQCALGADTQDGCNDRHLDEADEQAFIQVLMKQDRPPHQSKSSSVATPLVEKDVTVPSSSHQSESSVATPFVEKEVTVPSSSHQYPSLHASPIKEKEASKPSSGELRHPLWKPEWHRMLDRGALTAGACLFIGGVICTAGGIGGGGIYVTVLMFFGELSVHDAIPMSKVVVFAASLPSLILNLGKSIVLEEGSDASSKSLIDYNVCRVVIPWALIGTLLGVFLNTVVDGKIIVGMLCVILSSMTAMISKKGYEQHCEEELLEQKQLKLGQNRASMNPSPQDPRETQRRNSEQSKLSKRTQSLRNMIFPVDVKLAVGGLFLVIFSGTLRYHAISCLTDSAECDHPIAEFVSFGQLQHLKHSTPEALRNIDDWTWGRVVGYSTMATITGCLAGLVGIGGGLIFAPFFIQLGMDPHVAVATSSTCVIFTASSTTFQYLFADRIIVALIFSFGIPHLLAAYSGTKLVHYIQDNYGTKKSYITWIVAFGVAVSTFLAFEKLYAGDTTVH